MIFELRGKLIIDDSKKTVIFMDKGDQSAYTHIYGAARVIKEHIKDKFNIITIGSGCGLTDNYYEINRKPTAKLLRKVAGPDYREKNKVTLDEWLTESFKDLPQIDHIVLGTDDFFRLPLTAYASRKTHAYLSDLENEFFDYVGSDEQVLKDIDEVNDMVIKYYDKYVSPFAFSTQDYNLFTRTIEFINRSGKLNGKVIGFSIDPAIYTPYFDKHNVKSTFFYFADDKRGTRNFNQLDIAQLQHIVYDNKFKPVGLDDWDEPLVEKSHNMFFAGTIFQDKGSRRFIWDEFLNGVKSQKCSYYIPLRRNGINKSHGGKAEYQESLLKENENFIDLYESVKNHAHFKGSLLPHELNEKTQRYKYGMVFRCVSINDSLNFRPVLYTYRDILPLLDHQYDPACLQIPAEIQSKLIVRCAEDIEKRINFYNEHDDERINVLNDLKKHLRINEYIENSDEMIQMQIDKIFN